MRPDVVGQPYPDAASTGHQTVDQTKTETDWYGHEGPVEACTAYRIPVSEFDGVNVVFLALMFQEDSGVREEMHDAIAHASLHAVLLNTPIDLNQIDEATGVASPFAVQSVLDPQAVTAPRSRRT